MTFDDFANTAVSMASKTDSLSLAVEIWHDTEGYRSLKWNVWSDEKKTHYTAPNPEAALAKFREAMNRENPSELAGIGAVTLGAE